MASKRIVVIGGAHGGPKAAARARQFNEDAEICLIEKNTHVTWVQASLRHYIEGDLDRIEAVLVEREQSFSDRFNIDVRLNTTALGLDLDAKFVLVSCNGVESRIHFDTLIYAGGAISKTLDLKGLSGNRVCNFRNLNDLNAIRSALKAGAKSAVVIGCGPPGLAAAEAMRSSGLTVKVVEKEPRIMTRFPLSFSHAMVQELEASGVEVMLNTEVVSAEREGELGFSLTLSSGGKFATDLVIVTIGSEPRVDLLSKAGASLQKDGSLRVDSFMQTSLPNVFACGSAVSVPQAISQERTLIPQPAVIERSAQVAGLNAAMCEQSDWEEFHPVAGTQVLSVGKTWFARTGLTKSEARKHFTDEQLLVSTLHSSSTEKWMDDEALTISIMVDRESERILGADIFGTQGVVRRIDLLAAAVICGWTPSLLIDIDMAYSASLGPAFDPLKEVGMLANLSLKGMGKTLQSDQFALWLAENRDFTLLSVGEKTAKLATKNWKGKSLVVSLEDLRKKIGSLDKNAPLIVSSETGRRSVLAQRILMQKGFTDVYHLDGGRKTWSLMMGR